MLTGDVLWNLVNDESVHPKKSGSSCVLDLYGSEVFVLFLLLHERGSLKGL